MILSACVYRIYGIWVTFKKTRQSILNVKATVAKLISFDGGIYIDKTQQQTPRNLVDIFQDDHRSCR